MRAFTDALRTAWDGEKLLTMMAEPDIPGPLDSANYPATEQERLDLLAELRCQHEENWKP